MGIYVRRSKIPMIYAAAIPLALILGCLVSVPDPFTISLLGMILLFLALPLFIKWHHAMLIFFWCSVFNAWFLPGQPDIWLVFAVLSFGISFLNHIMFQKEFLRVPEMTRPLIFMAVVVGGTACYRGGIGLRALGATSMGGRYYVFALVAILGFYALIAEPIPIAKSGKLTSLFFLSGASFALSNLAWALGPAAYFLYYIVPANLANAQAASYYSLSSIDRISGLSQTCMAVLCFLLARYGVRGLFEWNKPWRLTFLLITVAGGFFSGFRSSLALLGLLLITQFYFEGLLRTRFLPIVLAMLVLAGAPVLLLSDHMPRSVQRVLSFLPVKVDADVRADAKGSTQWRQDMWSIVMKDLPRYWLIGKGYAIDPTEMYLTTESIRLGLLPDYEEAMLAGDYHNGALTVIIPLGIFGMAAFLWLLFAGGRVLYLNYRNGEPKLRKINTTLLACYVTHGISFFLVFGAFNSHFPLFLGLCGLSVSLNAGVRRTPAANGKPAHAPVSLAVLPG